MMLVWGTIRVVRTRMGTPANDSSGTSKRVQLVHLGFQALDLGIARDLDGIDARFAGQERAHLLLVAETHDDARHETEDGVVRHGPIVLGHSPTDHSKVRNERVFCAPP